MLGEGLGKLGLYLRGCDRGREARAGGGLRRVLPSGLCMATLAATRDPRALPPVQPDPPVNITVTPVDRNPRWLSVTWQDAPSWNSHFYRLQFELRYRAEKSKVFTTLLVSPSSAAAQRGAPDTRRGRNRGWPGPHAPRGPGRL